VAYDGERRVHRTQHLADCAGLGLEAMALVDERLALIEAGARRASA